MHSRYRILGFAPAGAIALLGLVGCTSSESTFVKAPDAALGRVVVYRNGVAYFERRARVDDGDLKLAVPADKVDDFLKSLTVVDARSGQPTPISYPTSGTAADAEGLVRMSIQVPKTGPRELKLSYVTEAPSWKPSYRLTLGERGKLSVQAWAIVDNTSGEDWKDVTLGVGASSALSFRFDLRSVRLVERETLQTDRPFAMAPPSGGAAFADGPRTINVLSEISDATLASIEKDKAEEGQPRVRHLEAREVAAPLKQVQVAQRAPSAPRPKSATSKRSVDSDELASSVAGGRAGLGNVGPSGQPAPGDPVGVLARQIMSNRQQVVIEGYAGKGDADKNAASLERANKLRTQLLQNGVAPDLVVAVGNGEQRGRGAGVRIVQAPPPPPSAIAQAQQPADGAGGKESGSSLAPIDTSHFESRTPMTVARGTSAMVAIYSGETEGEVVYLFDPESLRGNASFAFRSVRLVNPTDSALEAGPFTVFGQGRFIGEGLSETIPPKSVAFVPFALDRQIVVEKQEDGRDEIARIITVQRGVFSTEVKHIRKTSFVFANRLPERASIYVRHTVPQGYKLTKSPEKFERLGTAHLFRVDIEPGGKAELSIEEATPVFQSTDIRGATGMDMIKAFLSSAAVEAGLKEKVGELVKLQTEIGTLEQRILTVREQMGEYRARMDELHAQVVTLKVVKTAGPLMKSLEAKLVEVSDRVSKATIAVVGLEEALMVARIKFQDKVAELSLEKT
jgi:Domain of unknown function (DUF4139)